MAGCGYAGLMSSKDPAPRDHSSSPNDPGCLGSLGRSGPGCEGNSNGCSGAGDSDHSGSEGKEPSDQPAGEPSDERVHRVHDRYLVEVVEGLGLCPFARRSRELGRVHRPLFRVHDDQPTAEDAAACLAELVAAAPDAEIVLLTFIEREPKRFGDAKAFDAFVAEVREAYTGHEAPHFFMVGFHPTSGAEIEASSRELTRDSLVPIIRRTPDPVIQCVAADVLERARAQAQAVAHERLRESVAHDPVLRALVERSIAPDPELSAEIARNNFEAVGTGAGLEELRRRLEAIASARDEAYAARDHACGDSADPRARSR
jgi:hypothetical protein